MNYTQIMPKRVLKRLSLLLLFCCGAARAQEVVAVLGSDQRAQREALEGFQAAFGKTVPVLALGDPIPAEAKVILAFGGKAAIQRYPRRATVVYAIAPGLLLDRQIHAGPAVKIMMEPEASVLLARMKALQPGLKRLAILWSGASHAGSVERLARAGAALGVEVEAEQLEDADDLPSHLRELKGRADALWLLPDPLLISAHNFAILKHFSYGNDVPFYAPTEGLAEQGATAAVFVSYEEMGRVMAGVATWILGGNPAPTELYVDRAQVSINRAAAAEAELALGAQALKTADRVLP